MAPSITILVVDGYEALRELLRHMIQNERDGIWVWQAGSLDEADEIIERQRPHAVLCSGSFPTDRLARYEEAPETRDGNWRPLMQACERQKLPFVMLTRHSQLAAKLRAAGHEVFVKPGAVHEAVRRVVGLAEAHALETLLEDPRIALADFENSQQDDDGLGSTSRQRWWEKRLGRASREREG